MRKTLLFFLFALNLNSFSQSSAPPKINYQGIARTADLKVVSTGTIYIKFLIESGDNSEVFEEKNQASIAPSGVFQTQIGTGIPLQNNFSALSWKKPPYFLTVFTNTDASSNYVQMGPQQELVSVPYSLFSENAANPYLNISGGILQVNNSSISLPAGATQNLSTAYNSTLAAVPVSVTISGGNTIELPTPMPGTNITISPIASYPYYQISSNPQLSYVSGVLSISGGNAIAFPPESWIKNGAFVHLSSSSDNVGIGITNPSAKVDITNTFVTQPGLRVNDNGNQSGIMINKSSLSNGRALEVFQFNPSNISNALEVTNFGSGSGIYCTTTGSVSAIYGASNSSASSALAFGVHGHTGNTNPFAAGIYGTNSGNGPSVLGIKNNTLGNSAKFETTAPGNMADAMVAKTDGGGAAIHAICGTTVVNSSNVGVWIENAHLKSSQPLPPTLTDILSCTGCSSVMVLPGSTDMNGAFSINTGSGGYAASIAFRLTFKKSYTKPPIVVITPASADAANFVLRYYVTLVGTGPYTAFDFNLPTGFQAGGGAVRVHKFNYIVIESD